MNPELPPLPFSSPEIRKRRQQRSSFPQRQPPTPDQRRETALRVIREKEKVDRAMSVLTPEQKRAVILKLRHDRPLTPKDFTGTGLGIIGELGDEESLVYPKKGDLNKLISRAHDYQAGVKKSLITQPGLISALTALDIASAKERVSDDILEQYDDLTAKNHVVYEIEITATEASRDEGKREEVESIVSDIRTSLGAGIHGHVYDTDYQGEGAVLMVGTTGKKLQEWVESPAWWRKVTRFELRPRFQTIKQVLDAFSVNKVSIEPPPDDAETICIIDSGIAVGNPFLASATKRGTSKSWVYGASPVEDSFGHGSGVASLAAFHSISYEEGGENRASAWVTSARIMTDDGELDSPRIDDPVEDRTEQAWLLSRILREIVEHFVPLGVRIFVLAFQMQGHIWSHATRRQVARNAWIGRTIDQLSREFDVVFVGITGNLSEKEIEEHQELTQNPYPQYLLAPFAKLLDPGPSVLSVTCGSLAQSTQIAGAAHGLIANLDEPSPFTRSGPGFAGSIKPDVVEYGGSLVRHLERRQIERNMGTDVVMASNRLTPALRRGVGTSFAAPRVANHLAKILRDTKALGVQPSATLLRALLVASCKHPDVPGGLSKGDKLSLVGHGRPDGNDAMVCYGHSVLLYWDGAASVESTAIFRIHVPAEIRQAGRSKKRITVAVASAPAVQSWGLGEYLGANLKFWLYCGDKSTAEIMAQHQRESDESNDAPESSHVYMKGLIGITHSTEGTLQSDVFEWTDHKEEFSSNDYTLAVSVLRSPKWCKESTRSVPLSVVVRIEETSGVFQELYARVRARVRATV